MSVRQLRLAPDLALPPDAVTQTFAFLAKRGAGKTYTAGVLVEEMLKARQQVIVVDPLDVWWGLRSSADGSGPGLPITVLGGTHGDLPLAEEDAETIARFVMEHGASVVLSLRHLRKQARTRFLTPFLETLYHLAGEFRRPIHLAVDEADAAAPQRPMKGEERMLGAMEDIVRRGRSDGLGCSLISQRSAVLNKDVLSQTETLVALRTTAPQDMAAIDAWVRQHGEEEQRRALLASLPSLPTGDSWWWSPHWLELFTRTRVRPKETFDSSRTPKPGERVREPKQLAEVDLEALRGKLAKTIERAKAEDPKLLKNRIAELERELKAAQGRRTSDPAEIEHAVAAAVEAARQQWADDFRALVEKAVVRVADAWTMVDEAHGRIRADLDELVGVLRPKAPRSIAFMAPRRRERAETPVPRAAVEEPPVTIRVVRADQDGELTPPQQRILDVLAVFEALTPGRAPLKANVAAFAGVSPKSGSYYENLGKLHARELVAYPETGRVALTASGRTLARSDVEVRSRADLHEQWRRKLDAPVGRILDVLLERYPEAVPKAEIAEAVGVSPKSGSFYENLGALRSLGLVTYPSKGLAMASEILFPEGLRP